MSGEIDMIVSAPLWAQAPESAGLVRRAIAACRDRLGENIDAEIGVTLCDDDEIRALNKTWRNKDKATNVLSFPTPEGPGRALHLGDIVIAYETTAQEAVAENKTFAAHLSHLAVHGYLHLAGYDHEAAQEAEVMERMEREILAALGFGDPYAGVVQDEFAKDKDASPLHSYSKDS